MKAELESNEGLHEDEVTGVLGLLGISFESGGIISEISFPYSDGTPVKIACENNTGSEDKKDVESSTILDTRIGIEDII